MKSILDHSFQYSNSAETDLKKTFARVRRRLVEEDKERRLADVEAKGKVTSLPKATKRGS